MISELIAGIALTEESKTKVCIITDISKVELLLTGEPISTTQFDTLYDKDVDELNNLLSDMQSKARASIF